MRLLLTYFACRLLVLNCTDNFLNALIIEIKGMPKKRSPIYQEGAGLFQSRIPADQLAQQANSVASQQLISRSPTLESAVITSFDARPVNGNDFLLNGSSIISSDSSGVIHSHVVPQGVIEIIRGFKYYSSAVFAGILSTNITGRFNVDGITASGFESFTLGQTVSDYQSCYILANSGSIVTLTLKFSGAYQTAVGALGVNTFEFVTGIYGNRLLATGKPLSYEPGFTNSLPVHQKD